MTAARSSTSLQSDIGATPTDSVSAQQLVQFDCSASFAIHPYTGAAPFTSTAPYRNVIVFGLTCPACACFDGKYVGWTNTFAPGAARKRKLSVIRNESRLCPPKPKPGTE